MKKNLLRQILHALITALGLGLMVGGIVTGKSGAGIIGLCIAAVNVQQWIHWRNQQPR